MHRKISHTTKTFISLLMIALGSTLLGTQLFADETTTQSASKSKLNGTQWQLVEFQSMDDSQGLKRTEYPSKYTMHLHEDGTVTMHLNCNMAKGNWSAKESSDGTSGNFQFGPLASTRAICPPPTMDQEIIAQAKYIRGYLLKDSRLYLSLMADGGIYTWEPASEHKAMIHSYVAPEEGGPRNWEVTGFVADRLNLREHPSAKASIIERYALGTILDNLGCQKNVEGHIWCDVQKLGGGARGYVSSKFLKPAVSPDGTTATGADDSAFRAGQSKFDATGTLPCSFSKDQTMKACEFGVARAGGGYATVVISKADGRKRAVYFRMGKAIGADSSQAEGYPEFRSSKESDWHLIHVGKEFYKIPDAVIFGG